MSPKRFILLAISLWILAECGNQWHIFTAYKLNDKFNWQLYAYKRNQADIDLLNQLSNRLISTRAYIEVRSSMIVDSVGPIPKQIRELVFKLANDIEPSGSFYYDFEAQGQQGKNVGIISPCSPGTGCNCLSRNIVFDDDCIVLQLSSFSKDQNETGNYIDYIRINEKINNSSLSSSPCYIKIAKNEYIIRVENLPSTINYNSRYWDFLFVRLFRN